MRSLLTSFVFCALSVCDASGQALPSGPPGLLEGAKRVVFLGNSITYAGEYVTDIEMALLTRGLDVEVLNLGLPSETAIRLTDAENSDHVRRHGFGRPFLGERLERVLAETRPDLVFASYGINDGASLPAGDESVRRFAEAMEELRAVAKRHGVRDVVHLTPTVYDAAANPGAADYDPGLARFSAWLVGRRRDGWRVADVHTPMRRMLDERRRGEPAFAFAHDGVHPSREGHRLISRETLALLGVTSAAGANEEVRALVHQRMTLLRDAWLSQTGHSRPGMRPGLPLAEARARAEEITGTIRTLLREPAP